MLETIICGIISVNWLEVIKLLIPISTPVIAYLALQTWKLQLRAKNKIILLDELTVSIHEFLMHLSAPIACLKYVQISFESYIPISSKDKRQGAINFIMQDGAASSEKFIESLEKCVPSFNNIRMLSTKGQVLGFENYNDCFISCAQITRQYERLQSIAYFIRQRNLNWGNQKVLDNLDLMIEMKSEEMQEILDTYNKMYLVFLEKNYTEIYK
ncbi:hypothetical protein [Endozoicomonas ascidiicola]|uniref:hypothetical protein n=1 Tax=Endozoicomonas ascidiicola TaxID=1698521 RepID=UPI00082E4DB4|nr:hypothetical protein [Endozoicomonas ascidiicola]